MPGLDPGIHLSEKMDCRVSRYARSGNDGCNCGVALNF